MSEARRSPAKPPAFGGVRRKSVRLSSGELVRESPLIPGKDFGLLVEPAVSGVDAIDWAAGHGSVIEDWLLRHGAVLFRGFGLDSVDRFRAFVRSVTPDLLDYQERAAPRLTVAGGVYTSTEYPPEEAIPLHHEMSYSHNWPINLWFFCHTPPEAGGRTPLTDDREIFPRIGKELKEEFLAKRVMYVRNYGEGVDLSWQEAFQTDERAAVEDYCRRVGMDFEWRQGDRLRTRAVRQAVARHPDTGETVWFNHAHMFHVSNLKPEVRQALEQEFAEDELPRNAFFGDGTPIPDSTLEEIRTLYRSHAVSFPWQRGDLLAVDNFLASHGRESFSGPRKILVAMTRLFTTVPGS